VGGVTTILLGALLVLTVGFALWRMVTLPIRAARSVQRLAGTLQQRQADKAAGRPVSPVSVLGLAGIALAAAGYIVARTTSGIGGICLMVIGIGVILIGSQMAKAKQRTDHRGNAMQQNNSIGGGGGDGVFPTSSTARNLPPAALHAPENPTATFRFEPPQQAAEASPRSQSSLLKPPTTTGPTTAAGRAISSNPAKTALQDGVTPRQWAFLAVVASAAVVLLGIVIGTTLARGPEKTTTATSATNTVTQTFSAAATPTPNTVPRRVASDADAHGFVVFGDGARCFNSDPALMFMRTEKSALVVCRSEVSRLYYRGYRMSDGATIDLYDVYPQAGGYVAVNALDNARYVITSSGFKLIQNGDVVASEPAVEVGP
jgi:hypothetical protein